MNCQNIDANQSLEAYNQEKLDNLPQWDEAFTRAEFKIGKFNGMDIYQISKQFDDSLIARHKQKYIPFIKMVFNLGALALAIMIGMAFFRLGSHMAGYKYTFFSPYVSDKLLCSLPFPLIIFGIFRMAFAVKEADITKQVEIEWSENYKDFLQPIKNWAYYARSANLSLRAVINHNDPNDEKLFDTTKQRLREIRERAFSALENLKAEIISFDKFVKSSKNARLFANIIAWDFNYPKFNFDILNSRQ